MNWEWRLPTSVVFGAGTRARLPELLGGRRAALVRSKSAGEIPGEFAGVFTGIRPNPTGENVRDCAAFLLESRVEAVAALGGGSVLDCAKAAVGRIHEKSGVWLPIIALPTTSGTGSEVTNIAVVSDDAAGSKRPQMAPGYYPQTALVDPELTYTMPARVTAESGLDALSHAIEALWSIHHSPASDALALRAARMILDHLEASVAGNPRARDAMSEASLLAGMAFSQAKTAAVHACSFSLTTRHGLSHGAACAFTLAAFARVNGFDAHARTLGFADAEALALEIDRLKRAFGLPVSLGEAGIAAADIPLLAAQAMRPANIKNNPVPMDEAAIIRIYQSIG